MTNLYTDDDLYQAVMQRRKILLVFFGVLALYLAGLAAFIAYYVSLPYGDSNTTWVKIAVSALTVVFLFFAFPFTGIKFKRCNAYCKTMKYISVGLKESMIAPFAGIEDWTTRDGVDVNVACFTVPSAKRGETMIRQIFIDGEKDYPPFYEGDAVKVISQGNLMIGYEILARSERKSEAGAEEPESVKEQEERS